MGSYTNKDHSKGENMERKTHASSFPNFTPCVKSNQFIYKPLLETSLYFSENPSVCCTDKKRHIKISLRLWWMFVASVSEDERTVYCFIYIHSPSLVLYFNVIRQNSLIAPGFIFHLHLYSSGMCRWCLGVGCKQYFLSCCQALAVCFCSIHYSLFLFLC